MIDYLLFHKNIYFLRKILNYFNRFIPLKEKEIQAIVATLDIQTFKKGTILLEPGKVSKAAYFGSGRFTSINFNTSGCPYSSHLYAFIFSIFSKDRTAEYQNSLTWVKKNLIKNP